MFANAGMNQFKHVFTGAEQPKAPRATTAQKCVRAGGKHNDLDNVGYTARHHTFFEMMGNFSFGDYFKQGAIEAAWEFLTKVMGIPKEKLGVTVYHTDNEAFDIWKKLTGFADEKILRIPTSDNFWQMGDTGPCGPCSEIFYDHGEQAGEGQWALDENGYDLFGERYVEIWNLVFMQFDRQPDGTDKPLPKPCIDTGMGLERMTAVAQGVFSNYDIDLFQNLMRASEELTGTKASGEHAASHRVIADHLRSSCFLMADGVLPSNEGRGYVLRRIMRRAMRHAHILGAKEPLMHRLVPALLAEMGDAYPELTRAEALITENLRLEEERFKVTLERGLKLLDEEISQLSAVSGQDSERGQQAESALSSAPCERQNVAQRGQLEGAKAFQLYDTYGFPLDLTQDILRGRGMTVDEDGFHAAMAEQKARARAAWSGSGDAGTQAIWLELRDTHGATEFTGYTEATGSGKVLAIVKDGEAVERLAAGEKGQLIFNQTPFYAESGGQQGDYGFASTQDKKIATITNTTKPVDGLHVHHVNADAPITVGDELTLRINDERRTKLRSNHSATHLLNAALKLVLGDHIAQKGSDVAEDRLRFDISHQKRLSAEEITQVERLVNEQIWLNLPTETKLMPTDEAIEAGAVAMFGEKYGDEVRVLSMGELRVASCGLRDNNTPSSCDSQSESAGSTRTTLDSAQADASQNDTPAPFSIELCGGTHVQRTGDIGLFKITSEGALAAGIRRIEAVTRDAAFAYLTQRDALVAELADALKVAASDIPNRLTQLQAEKKKLEKELADARKKLAMGGGGDGAGLKKEVIGNITFASQAFDGINPKELRDIANDMLQQIGNGLIAIGSNFDGKAALIIAATKDVSATHSSAELIKVATPVVGGKGGGGKPEMAQGGGPDGNKVSDALEAVKQALVG